MPSLPSSVLGGSECRGRCFFEVQLSRAAVIAIWIKQMKIVGSNSIAGSDFAEAQGIPTQVAGATLQVSHKKCRLRVREAASSRTHSSTVGWAKADSDSGFNLTLVDQ